MDILPLLRELGLTEKEPEVYLALLMTEGVQPASVIAKKADLNRTTTYKILVKLAQMGLVTKTAKRGITAFFAEDPDKSLETLLENKRKKVEQLNRRLLSVLPEIKTLKRQEMSMPKMRVYEGLAGVIRAYEDTVQEQYTIRSFENIQEMAPAIKDYMEKVFVPKRVGKGNFAYVLSPKNEFGAKARKDDKKYLREARFAPADMFAIETGINIYGDKISFFSYDPNDMFGVILESKAFAKSMREIFDYCWHYSK
jgi:sugar-specific transcriptional regulator TrmB